MPGMYPSAKPEKECGPKAHPPAHEDGRPGGRRRPGAGYRSDAMTTATAPDGAVHTVTRAGENDYPAAWVTLCGQDAGSWSRAVTDAQRAGLVLFCPVCTQLASERPAP